MAQTIVIEQVPIEMLHPDPANPNRMSPATLEELTRGMDEFGMVQRLKSSRAGWTNSEWSSPSWLAATMGW